MNHTTALKLSLLVALGIVPAACGGSTNNNPDDETGGSGGSGTTGGASNKAGSTNKAGGSNKAGSGGSGAVGHACTSPTLDPVSGLITCAEGYAHRAQAVVCGATGADGAEPPSPGEAPAPNQLPRADGSVGCAMDASVCTRFLYGFCKTQGEGGGPPPRTCFSGCVTDSDCDRGYVCSCDNPSSPTGGTCHQASCQTDHDCGDGLCTLFSRACGSSGFACQSDADKCQSDADCSGMGSCNWESSDDGLSYHRECTSFVCGRPFLVDQEVRVAPVVSSAAWTTAIALAPRLDHLTSAERAALADHWTRMGQMEHASIAAFARFSLQLLSLGAPPELVDACTQALGDETTHTKLCFALASAYAGRAIGPGPLDVSRSLEVTSLADIVDLVIAEGCFGETSAALEALEAAETATDPVIVAAYSQIARDEQRHAELAFRFVRWALAQGGDAVAARLQAALEAPASAAAHAVALPCLRALLQNQLARPESYLNNFKNAAP